MNQQRFVCVWFDNQSKQSNDSLYTQDELRTIIDSFRYFNEINQCLDFIVNIKNINLILITLNEDIIPIIHYSEQIHSIYILTTTSIYSRKDYQKIQGNFQDVKIICQNIKENIIPSKNNPIGISFISSNDIHSNDTNRQDPAFMYSQLLKEIILNDYSSESDEETKYEMITYCRNIYTDDQDTLKILNEFDKNFLPELSIYWYTRECFLYKILNKALWTPQPDVLYKLRYFLRHLHQQILSQSKFQRSNKPSMIVYRGQNMSANQIRKFKQNVGGFLSFNNFLSTSLQRDVGLSFIAGSQIGVLFEMFIDTTIEKFPFANIEHLSFQQGPNNEKELLFSMGTVFRIVGMDTEKNFHRIQLMLTSDMDEQLEEYTKRTREETHSSCCFLSFLKLMNELKQYNSVDRFAEMFDNDRSLLIDPDVLDGIHNVFGLTYHDRGQLSEALEHFHKSLSTCLITLPADHPKLAVTYNNIGAVYSGQSDYKTALRYYKLALDCQTHSDNPNILSIITYTNNIASIYNQQENYSEALEYHKRALELQKQYLGENDPSLSDTYNAISIIYYQMNDYEQTTSFHAKAVALQDDTSELDPESSAHCSITTGAFCISQQQYSEALEHLNRALQIQQKYFLPNNPSLATTHNFIANVHFKLDQFEQSLSNHCKALEIEQNALSDDHPSIATSYFDISKDYAGLLFWADALKYGLKAIEQIKKSPQTDVDTLPTFIGHIAKIYYQRDEYEKALKYYKEALDLFLTYMPDNDASLVVMYYQTAETYYKLERFNDALSYYHKTLNIELKTLPENAKTIATTYSDISASYIRLGRWDEAFTASNQAHEQLLKTLPYDHPEVMRQREALNKLKTIQILREGQD